jgi:ribosomal protein S24E
MELKIIENNRSEVLKRNDIIGEFDQKTIPQKEEIRKNLSAQLNIPTNRMVIRKIDVKFGSTKGKVIVKAYDTEENLNRIEAKFVKKRNETKKTEAKKEEENAEEKKE